MPQTNYAGIDYSLGRSNVDSKTGIHYGVIAQNSVSPDALDDIWQNSRDLSYESAVGEMKAAIGRLESESELADFLKEHFGSYHFNPTERAKEIVSELEKLPMRRSETFDKETIDAIWNDIEQDFNDRYENNGDYDWLYESDGYKLTNCLSTDIFVLASPFYTFAQFCSPCIPGAGNLNSPCVDGAKTYCLGHDFFEDGVSPYPIFSVKTGELLSIVQ